MLACSGVVVERRVGIHFSHSLPYASIYDIYAPVVGWDKVRLTTFFDPEFDKLGASNLDGALMWRFKHQFP